MFLFRLCGQSPLQLSKSLGYRRVGVLLCVLQRRVTILVFGVGICSCIEQKLDDLDGLVLCGPVKCGLAIGICRLDVVAGLDSRPHGVDILLLNRFDQGCDSLLPNLNISHDLSSYL